MRQGALGLWGRGREAGRRRKSRGGTFLVALTLVAIGQNNLCTTLHLTLGSHVTDADVGTVVLNPFAAYGVQLAFWSSDSSDGCCAETTTCRGGLSRTRSTPVNAPRREEAEVPAKYRCFSTYRLWEDNFDGAYSVLYWTYSGDS